MLIINRIEVTLPEPTRLRPSPAAEGKKLSEFQTEMVQLGAVLNGDHAKDIYPHELVENMTVAQGAEYLQNAFKTYLKQCKECQRQGADGSHVVEVIPATAAAGGSKSLIGKMTSCLLCNKS